MLDLNYCEAGVLFRIDFLRSVIGMKFVLELAESVREAVHAPQSRRNRRLVFRVLDRDDLGHLCSGLDFSRIHAECFGHLDRCYVGRRGGRG